MVSQAPTTFIEMIMYILGYFLSNIVFFLILFLCSLLFLTLIRFILRGILKTTGHKTWSDFFNVF